MDLTDFRRNLDIVGKGQERTRKKKLVKEEITAKTTPAEAVKELQGQKYDMANSEIRVSFDSSGLDPTDDDNPIGQEKLYDLGRKLKSIDVEPKDELWNEYAEFAGVTGDVSEARIENLIKFIQSKDNSVQEDEVVEELSKASGEDLTGRQHVKIEPAKKTLKFFLGDSVKAEPEAGGATLTQKMADDGRTVDQATNAEAISHLKGKGASEREAKAMIQAAGGNPDDSNETLDDTASKLSQVVANAEDEGTLTPDEVDEPEADEEIPGEEGGEVNRAAQSIVNEFEQIAGPKAYDQAIKAARSAKESNGESAGSDLAKLGAAFLIANGIK